MPTNYPDFAAGRTRVTATGTIVLSTGNNIALLGILNGSVTGPTIYASEGTSGLSAPVTIIAAMTCAMNAFTRIPAYCPGGATFTFSGVVPDLTIYWNPMP